MVSAEREFDRAEVGCMQHLGSDTLVLGGGELLIFGEVRAANDDPIGCAPAGEAGGIAVAAAVMRSQ